MTHHHIHIPGSRWKEKGVRHMYLLFKERLQKLHTSLSLTSSWLKSSRMTTCSCKEAEQLYISSEFSCVPLTHQSLWKKREIQNWVTSSSFCNILIFLQKVNPWIIHLQFGPIFTFSENKSFIIGKHYYTLHWKYLMLCAVLEKGMKALMPLCKL